MFSKVLIANRGAIACRIIRTLRRMGIASVAVYSEADAGSAHVDLADEALLIGPAPAAQSYLVIEKILEAARQTGAQAIHPGYGFLSENPGFAEACAAAGITFIGPKPDQMRNFGLKHSARAIAVAEKVPLLPGTGLLKDSAEALREAARIGYPVMLKSTAGGGGIGMQLIWREADLPAAFESVERLSRSNFKEGGLYLEKYVQRARHIEVQIFGDGRGNVAVLGERECSVQRRNQKIIEETPAPGLSETQRSALFACAEKLGKAAAYESAGTVEFVYDDDTGSFYFLEVNTRLQVEHGVTEEVTGVDLVEWMLRQAAGELDLSTWKRSTCGASLQVRLYSEDPGRNFSPCTGLLTEWQMAPGIRVETWVARGSEVSPYYDPMLAKLITRGADRAEALAAMQTALALTRVGGLETNLRYLRQILVADAFVAGRVTTRYLDSLPYLADSFEVLEGGTQTTVQDHPGRLGYWDAGVPPSGPMDPLAFRLANRLAGNGPSAAGLEITLSGPTLRFNCDALVALTGAELDADLDGRPVSSWTSFAVSKGSILRLGKVKGAGMRAYLALRGGLDLPDYLGSRSTFTLGLFGGHCGRALRTGDILHLCAEKASAPAPALPALPPSLIPSYAKEWSIGVMYGPHGAPDFFHPEDITDLFNASYEVHFNSARTGVRLIGPKPRWARTDGGEAGLHPSNIHDNAYAVGTIDFTGDMPIILGPDGPSLGGFVCPATIISAELWKCGQLRPGDRVRFVPVTAAEARLREQALEAGIETLQSLEVPALSPRTDAPEPAVLARLAARGEVPSVCYRRAGDKYLLVEYGPLVLDMALRFRVHALAARMADCRLPGIIDLTPGIRSLQVHYDSRLLTEERLVDALRAAEAHLPGMDDIEVPSRIVHLPLSWEDESTLLAIRKYMQTVRKDAPWCPSNIDFIRRINGLDTVDEVKRIAFEASYLVLGLGDVYLGAPVATPIDPRHRLVTTKYNPARTWTPENAVGIGGAYMCVYGMEGPGGYQFIGRTLQMWNRWRSTADFTDGKPWLLRFFDQIRFYPVSAEELLRIREDFPKGRFKLRVEETTFKYGNYHRFLSENASSINTFQTSQRKAFHEERDRWAASGQLNFSADAESASAAQNTEALPEGHRAVQAFVPGNVWKQLVGVGQTVTKDQPLVILESMKMEISINAPADGTITQLCCVEGKPVQAGDTVAVLREAKA